MNKDCYYFSYTSGIEEKVGNNQIQPEFNHDIKDFTDSSLGFDISEVNRLKWQDIPREKGESTLFGKFLTF